MNKEVNENWINTYIKNNPFRFKETIIHQCRQMDKADVYEWLADNEVKIIQLQEKVNQLETNRDEAIKYINDEGIEVAFVGDEYYFIAERRQKELLEILERDKK